MWYLNQFGKTRVHTMLTCSIVAAELVRGQTTSNHVVSLVSCICGTSTRARNCVFDRHLSSRPVWKDESARPADLQCSRCRAGEGREDERAQLIICELNLRHVN